MVLLDHNDTHQQVDCLLCFCYSQGVPSPPNQNPLALCGNLLYFKMERTLTHMNSAIIRKLVNVFGDEFCGTSVAGLTSLYKASEP